ncbi:hypothetical protein C2845_PM08G15560 [Panicum miliaceum]|uniref:ABC transporter B family member 9-like n=1 Tax=Panicum miliaceum TaxID=4540 RepID=A0A3L6QYD4_PANMI|nr:hypothetical protein C2845_PM08G15560 [Panicum miliaceum]
MSLVEIFYDPQAGQVLIDGVDIRRMKLGWIRGKIGLVSQEPVLFSTTIRENIAYGMENLTLEDIKAATELANAAKFIDNFPSGIDTMVGEHGIQLSGGQKQRTAIARAIVKNPKILLLDEATSALDMESERVVQEALNRLVKGSSSIGHSDRHSFSASPRIPDTTEFSPAPNIEDDKTHKVMTNGPKKAPIARLFYLNKPEVFVLALGSITAAMHGVILPLFGTLISTAIKAFYEPPQKLPKDSRFWASMFVALGAYSFVPNPVEYFLFGLAGGKLVERIRSLMFQSVMSQDINWFDKPEHSSGLIGARLSTYALIVKQLVGDNLALNVQTLSTIVSGRTIAMVANWKMTLIITFVLPFVGLQAYAQMLFLKGVNKNAKLKYEEASQVATDAVGGIRTVASFCAEKNVMKTYEMKCKSPIRQGIREGVVGGLGFGFSLAVFYFAYALCFYVGAKFVQQGKATFPEIFKVFFVLVLGAEGISRSSAIGADSNKINDAATSVFEILDCKSKMDYSSEEGVTIASVRGDIDFQNTVALVGESGSGKSTVIALLERFYDPDSGSIFLDDIDLQTFKGRLPKKRSLLLLKQPIAHEFISAFPDGYNTIVGERGIQLSGGQKQRVAIARAIIKNPKVLLLDEATSALDVESERVVQEALDNVVVGRTTVVVAHLLSTIRGADAIAVLKNGTVVEKGSHGELC